MVEQKYGPHAKIMIPMMYLKPSLFVIKIDLENTLILAPSLALHQ